MGVRGLAVDLFKTILYREQYADYEEYRSELIKINCGVSKKSVLGPLSFILLTNDFTNIFNEFNSASYADDTCLIKKIINKYN